tara:strand:- start:27 stop:560 length:534 start_codon:yes stop_codon:yes gene_type:complete
MSELRTNRIVPRDGLPSGSSGGIIQIVHTNTSSHTYNNNTSYADITGVTATITPTRSDSKILIQCSLAVSKTDNHSFLGRVVRNGSAISGSGGVAESGHSSQEDGTWWLVRTTAHSAHPLMVSYLDSPSSTSAVTYKAQGKTSNSGQYYAINRTVNSEDNIYASPGFSSITLMEVSG